MDDKTRIKILHILLAMSTLSGMFYLVLLKAQLNTIRKLCLRIDGMEENIQDHRAYIQKIIEVTAPSEEQLEVINRGFDWYKWSTEVQAE